MRKSNIIYFVITACCFTFCSDINESNETALLKSASDQEGKKNNKDGSGDVTIQEKWDLPEELKEVSGISYLEKDRFACVQDELGTIFIYNTGSGTIEKKIPFSGVGDYEGISVSGNMAYIIRADGRLFEVNMEEGSKSVKEYATHLTVEQNVEGIWYDAQHNRVLLAIKGNEPGQKNYKGIYAFDISSKKINNQPVFKIALDNSLFNESNSKKDKLIMPSEIAVHPTNGDIYITDGPQAKLVIMDQQGNMKAVYKLGKRFSQPEGITFSPQGDLFISNEGTKDPGNIMQVKIQP